MAGGDNTPIIVGAGQYVLRSREAAYHLAQHAGGWILAAALLSVAAMIAVGNVAKLRRGDIDPLRWPDSRVWDPG